MRRRGAVAALLVVLSESAMACKGTGASEASPGASGAVAQRKSQRFVSLAPAITETLIAIGARKLLVGVSDYCRLPSGESLPRAGSGVSPNYEAIARLQPELILTEAMKQVRHDKLHVIAKVEALPWLTLDDVIRGTRRLGALSGREQAARALAGELERELAVPVASVGPRVLLVLAQGSQHLDPIWFIRDNSLHGAALRAAGARNAVAEAVAGQPKLSVEQLLKLDPDVIILLHDSTRHGNAPSIDPWLKLTPLHAVRRQRILVLDAPQAYANGPDILKLKRQLVGTLSGLKSSP